MKICLVSPQYNGLMKYSMPLYEILKNGENEVLYTGFSDICFDIKKIETQLDEICKKIIQFNPDIIHYNYGTYDSEQLIFYKLKELGFKCKNIYTYHSLQLDLFKKLNHNFYDEVANKSIGEMDGIVFFTEYAKEVYMEKYGEPKKYTIAYHPATHEKDTLTQDEILKYSNEFGVDVNANNVMLLGYASHWKESNSIVYLSEQFKDVNFYIAGPYWAGKVERENKEFNINNYSNLKIIDKELDQKEFLFFVENGIGFFPYNYFKSFQGSGLLPNYLLKGKPCLVNNIKPLQEYTGDYEFCFDFSDRELLKQKLKQVLKQDKMKRMKDFSYEEHHRKINNFYKEF